MIELREYQEDIARKGTDLINEYGFCYLAMEVRTGKTLTSLSIADRVGADHVLFLTKKKAISSITADVDNLCPSYAFFVINYESIHKLPNVRWDLIVLDEAHSLGAYPKSSKRARDVGDLIRKNNAKVILLSGTPTPESFSQMYHQVYAIPRNPFANYKNFYRFADEYVVVKQRKVGTHFINDYSGGDVSIIDAMKPYTISWTQKQSGFVVDTREHVVEVEMLPLTYSLVAQLKEDRVIEGREEDVVADTAVKLMSKTHQLFSGTVKFESGASKVLDDSKARAIYDKFKGRKVGIFYKFKAELEAIKAVFGDEITDDLSVFEDTEKSIALQIVSGREGISLRQASALVYYNIDFSATSYWQSRDRMTTMDRLESDVYWFFARGGIEHKIYKAVTAKKDYTLRHFKRDLLSL